MSTVYVLLKHPPLPYVRHQGYMVAGEIVGVYSSKDEPQKLAEAKNARTGRIYHYSVKRVNVKPSTTAGEQP